MAYQLVSNVSLPGFDLTFGSQQIGLLHGPRSVFTGPSTISTSRYGSLVRPTPSCSNCSGTGCMQCQKGGRSRRRLSTRRRRSRSN